MRAPPKTTLPHLGDLPGLNTTSLSNLSLPQKQSILSATSKICQQLMQDLGVKWKAQPIDSALHAGLTYTERVYEGGDFETKCSMVKYVTVAIYLDDLIDKDANMAKEAESFLVKMLSSPPETTPKNLNYYEAWLNQYRLASLELAKHMSDPLEQDQQGSLVPHGWPIWLRERSAVAETFAITSFRAPYGIDIPTWVWVTAISELRTIILSINDVLSFAKELMDDDTTSSIAVLTKERRMIGMPGTAEDGGWCLRDTFEEVCGKLLVAGARINRLLRPKKTEARYAADGRAYTVEELTRRIKEGGGEQSMKALALKLWETYQRGYVAWHFQSLRYRTHELFDWVPEMM
ncbi:isoprenoid synthase domain-containing protein [Podospora fimiseda]|uniref:Isoprenoid synthase domain-containing protein n=1 Tax=Podospora fimiseda TaxID=252190 RepID=A0AAN6YQI5_9PEZI|nr:isoprenoid synthase domain-containing protein [Podospora fimiseda]